MTTDAELEAAIRVRDSHTTDFACVISQPADDRRTLLRLLDEARSYARPLLADAIRLTIERDEARLDSRAIAALRAENERLREAINRALLEWDGDEVRDILRSAIAPPAQPAESAKNPV